LIADPQAMNARIVFEIATSFEGHPDNAAPAVFGRGTIAWMNGVTPRCARFDVHPEVKAMVAIPADVVSTRVARAVLTDRVSREVAIHNVSRSALEIHALTTEPSLLFEATEDKLHQDERGSVMPATLALVRMLRSQRIPAVVSGAGPSVLILSVLTAEELASEIPDGWQVCAPAIASHGGTVARINSSGSLSGTPLARR
jgi:homoserine kinase